MGGTGWCTDVGGALLDQRWSRRHAGRIWIGEGGEIARPRLRWSGGAACGCIRSLAITVAEWVVQWWPTITNIAERAAENYRRRLLRQILPRLGASRLCDITSAQVNAWAYDLSAAGYARSTVASQLKLLSMMLTDAVDARLLAANPVRLRRHRGRRLHPTLVERVWAMPEQVVRIGAQASALGGPTAELLIITAGWTGARWGELTGLQRGNVHLDEGYMMVDRLVGALHESRSATS